MAGAVTSGDLETIALQKLGLDYNTLRKLREEHIHNPGRLNMEVLKMWQNRTSMGDKQVRSRWGN